MGWIDDYDYFGACMKYPGWNAKQTYKEGDEVMHNYKIDIPNRLYGESNDRWHVFRALRANQGVEPHTNDETWEVIII